MYVFWRKRMTQNLTTSVSESTKAQLIELKKRGYTVNSIIIQGIEKINNFPSMLGRMHELEATNDKLNRAISILQSRVFELQSKEFHP